MLATVHVPLCLGLTLDYLLVMSHSLVLVHHGLLGHDRSANAASNRLEALLVLSEADLLQHKLISHLVSTGSLFNQMPTRELNSFMAQLSKRAGWPLALAIAHLLSLCREGMIRCGTF